MADKEFFDADFSDVDNVIHSISRKVAKQFRLNWNEYGEDLVSCGWIGAMRAKDKYEEQGYKFITYAHWFINGDIRREAVKIVKRTSNTCDLSELENVGVDGMVEQIALKEILSTADGLALLADEMSDNKQSATVRRKQRANLRQAYEEVQ